MLRHVVFLLALSLILGIALSSSDVDDKEAAKAARKAAREEARKEREEKRLAMRKEIQDLKEQNRDLTKELNEKSKQLDKCDGSGNETSVSGADQEELNKLKEELAASQAEVQRLKDECGESGISDELAAKCHAWPNNVAYNKSASQSRVYDSTSSADKAVDGSDNPFRHIFKSCAISMPSEQGAWWQVDLGKAYFVQSVRITNRALHSDRLRDFEIRLYNEDPSTNTEATSILCARHEGIMLSKETSRFSCENGPIKARYVRVINAPNQYLQLCEVKVMALRIDAETETCPADEIPVNVASGKQAKMSSLYHAIHPASNALDNNFSPYADLTFSSCAHTRNETSGPWWQVDLGQNYNIHYVVVGNRGAGYGQRLRDFSVKVYRDDPTVNPSAEGALCAFYTGPVIDGRILNLACQDGPLEGRYVRITNAPNYHLQLCEVEVFATKA